MYNKRFYIYHICLYVCLNLSLGLFDEAQTQLCFENFNSSIEVHFFIMIFSCHMEGVPYFFMEFNLT